MAFVNEYVPDEDVKKYKLDEIWLKYHPVYTTMPGHYRHHWTVDREKDAFLEHVETGREEYSNRHTFVFYWQSEQFEVKLDLSGSKSLNERPNKTIWEFVGIWPSQPKAAPPEEALDILKEALTVRGYDGARRQLPDTIVEFKNF